jgi:hypothetical protein
MGIIDLDPASCSIANATVKATKYYSMEDNGLNKAWSGHVWMNPPYCSALIGLFADKLIKHYAEGDIEEAIVLVNNATETAWFNRFVSSSSAIVFPRKRIRYETAHGKAGVPLQGQAILYFGTQSDKFLNIFTMFGWGAMIKVIL